MKNKEELRKIKHNRVSPEINMKKPNSPNDRLLGLIENRIKFKSIDKRHTYNLKKYMERLKDND